MKGQYFLISGIILITLFYMGFYMATSDILLTRSFHSDDMKYIAMNIESEYPRAFNYGVNSSDVSGKLMNFSEFIQGTMSGKLVNFSALWVYAINISDNLNITVGNHMGSDMVVTLNVSGAVQNLTVSNGKTNSTVFAGVSDRFNLTISFNNQQKKLSMIRDKHNLYAYIQLTRGDEIIRGDVWA